MEQCVYPLPTQFFMRKRGLASGITSCGGGIGGAVWSIAVQKMISGVGLEWTYRILGESLEGETRGKGEFEG